MTFYKPYDPPAFMMTFYVPLPPTILIIGFYKEFSPRAFVTAFYVTLLLQLLQLLSLKPSSWLSSWLSLIPPLSLP
jgi:hypothetical protein